MSSDSHPHISDTLRQKVKFANRDELVAHVRNQFPQAAERDSHVAAMHGGYQAARNALTKIDPKRYLSTRNYLDGEVTRLSPYLRHGVLSLAEVRNHALGNVRNPRDAAKLINELGWRDYFQRVYRTVGDRIWQDMEPYKTGFAADSYAPALPNDLLAGETGEPAIDAFVQELYETGYLHNHARMWLAAYVAHWRRVRWQAGAKWFLTHLLDGDPASNNLSWQWVASTFSHKPYIFNQDNLNKFTRDQYKNSLDQGTFDASYEMLTAQLFPNLDSGNTPRDNRTFDARDLLKAAPPLLGQTEVLGRQTSLRAPVIWVHGDCLSPHSTAFEQYPNAPAVWVWDSSLLDQWEISLKRIIFLYECLQELPVTVSKSAPVDGEENVTAFAAELLRFVAEQNADGIITVNSPSPRFRAICRKLSKFITLNVLPLEPFVEPTTTLDLRRFSRYWRKVEKQAMFVG